MGSGGTMPLERRLGGPQSWSERSGEEKKFPPLLGIEQRSSSPLRPMTPK